MDRRKKRGFTTVEVILVVAIISILLAIAAPNVIDYYRGLKLTELDDSARSIFLAAQNRLTALKAANTDFSGLEATNKVDLRSSAGTGAPELIYATQEDLVELLVPAGSIDQELQDNHYVVEFDPETGAVYAVWYWEKESFTYKDDAYINARPERSSRLRAGMDVGYYGGTYVDRATFGQMPIPQVTLTNAEELVLRITVPVDSAAIKDENIFVSVSVNGEELLDRDRNIWKGHTGTVVLDTLMPEKYPDDSSGDWTVGKSFKDWHIAGVTPGDDITLRVTLYYQGGEFLPQSLYVTGNSLFASRSGGTANIAYGRYLQNLDTATSGVKGVTWAVQAANIDFAGAGATGVYSWPDTYTYPDGTVKAFTPVSNGELTGYEGGWHAVKNLTTSDTGDDAGLFAHTVTGFGIRDLTLIDARVKGAQTAGAIVGRALGSISIENCGVYITDPAVNYRTRTVAGEYAGGLVGLGDGDMTVKNSFASAPVSGGTVGGLVGKAGTLTVDSSYAAGYLAGTAVGGLAGTAVGGLAGGADGHIAIKNSYAAGIIDSGETVGGLTPAVDAAVEDAASGGMETYAAVVYGQSFRKTGAVQVYGAYPGGAATRYVYEAGVNFAPGSGSGTLTESMEEPDTAVPYLLTADTQALTTVYPYARTVKGEDGALLPHYGDWLVNQVRGTELAYVEWYEGGGVGLYSAKIDATGAQVVRNTLSNDRGAVVIRDGYRVISNTDPTSGGRAMTEDSELTALLPGGFTAYEIDNTNADHSIYKTLAITDGDGDKTFIYNPDFACETFDITEAPGTDVTGFLSKPGVTGAGTAIKDVIVRSARHLARVSEYTREVTGADGWSFTQLLDVDYKLYEKSYAGDFTVGKDGTHRQTPARLGTNGKYDGRRYLIRNLWLGEDSDNRSGLFGSVDSGAVVEETVLVNANAAGTGDTGALAGYCGDGCTIQDCGVYCEGNGDYDTFTVTSQGVAGGLVGAVHGGSVSRSFAAVRVSGKTCAGGFAGSIENGAYKCAVMSCYAGGRTVGGVYLDTDVNVTSQGAAGGFVGKYAGGTFSGVNYSTCSVGSADTSRLGLFAGEGGDIPKGADNDLLYSAGAAFRQNGGAYVSGTPRGEKYLLVGAALPGGSVILENTFNYDSAYDGERYPYASRINTHHGDWGVPKTAGIFYWELENGVYRFYALTWDGAEAAVEDGLCRSHPCGYQVEDWGYGVFGLEGTDGDVRDSAKAALEKFRDGRPAAEQAYTIPRELKSFTVDTGINGKKLICDTRFGAAVAEEGSDLRREIRAFDQLENVKGNGTLKFYQTHDISAKDKTPVSLSLTGTGLYDGGFYRILDMDMDAGSGDAALFSAVENGAAVKGVILYAPGGDGVISGKNAAGITARLENGTVDSCVVAGYTVSGTGRLGGLVAETRGDSAVKNSEATVALTSGSSGAEIGGLLGYVSGTLTVENCYAGGSIDTRDGGTAAKEAGSIGGIVGAGDVGAAVTYANVYSYLDMTSAKGGKVYGIGPGEVAEGSRISEYWYAGLPASAGSVNKPVENADKDTAGLLGVTLAQLRNDTQKLEFSAEELYVPGADGLTNKITYGDTNDTRKYAKFPFAAFVTDGTVLGDVRNIHYGAAPTSAYAGLFYYEKEEIARLVNGAPVTETVYNYYAYGGEIYKNAMRGEKLLDGLCYDHHLTGERASIVETGYGYFFPEGGDIEYKLTVDGKNASGSELGDDSPVKVNLIKSLSANGSYRVFTQTYAEENKFDTLDWKLEATLDEKTVGEVTMYVNAAFGAVITENKSIGDSKGGDTPENFIQIRTKEQLETYLEESEKNAGKKYAYLAFTHDIDLEGEDWTPRKASAEILDGRGYRILDLNTRVESVTSGNGDAALFSTTQTDMTIRNIILYSPTGAGRITSTVGNAAGIVANGGSGLTIQNCIVSGYTITGCSGKYVGGIVGECGNGTTIDKCQTDVILTGSAEAIGGIAGQARGETPIEGCISGGQVYHAAATTAVGGIYGDLRDNKTEVTVSDCYTYMDLIESGSRDVYPVGATGTGTVTITDPAKVLYLKSMMPTAYHADGQGTDFDIATFPGRNDEATDADYTFVFNDGNPFDGLAYETIDAQCYHNLTYATLDLDPNHDTGVDTAGTFRVHYGDWPGTPRVVGAMYWEIDDNNSFTYHLMGIHLTGAKANLRGGICIDRHVGDEGAIEEHRITASGYALVNMDTENFPDIKELSGLTQGAVSGEDVAGLIKNALGITDETNLLIKVYPTPAAGNVAEDYSLTLKASGVETTVYYTNGFAEVSDHAFGTSDQSVGRVYPYYLRTTRQLDNIPDGVPPTVSFVINHDLYGKDHTGYTGAVGFCGSLDGQSYKILDLNITTGTDVGVVASTGPGARILNLIVYSTAAVNINANSGVATLKGTNVGGILGRAAGRTTITNSAAAGHVIAGTGALGGLVGKCESLLDVENCEAASFIVFDSQGGVNAGGILGGREPGAEVSIVNCYAGGKITTPTRSSCVAGGLVGGAGGSVSVSGSYSYANLLDAKTGNIFAIGQDVEVSGSVQYLKPYIAGSVKTDGQGEGTGVFMLSEGGAGSRANWSYKSGETPVLEGNNGYHFRAVLTVDGKLEHYGPWPGLAGLMYWEISKINGANTFKYHFIGLDEFGNGYEYSTLCTDHHTTPEGTIQEHMILTSGYALINTCDGGASITDRTSSGSVSVLTYGEGDFARIKTDDPVADEALHTMINLMGFTPAKIGLTAVCNNTTQNATEFYAEVQVGTGRNPPKKTVYCTYGLAEVSESAFGKDDNPYIVRTRQQLANMDTDAHLTGGYSYRQAHDIYGHATDDPDKSREDNAFKPIGAATKKGFKGTFDGQGYRILELDIMGVNNHAALFYTTDASTVKNIILYSPSGEAWIKVRFNSSGDADSLNAAGISADSAENATISNCVVAGYTIAVEGDTGSAKSHDHYLGGIGAWFRGTVENCQAIVTLDDSAGGGGGGRAFIGGIVGGTNGTTITGCVAGGLVNRTSDTAAGKDTVTQYVGGMVGSQENGANKPINNCYSYMDMSDLIGDDSLTCNLYSITSMEGDSPINSANTFFNITNCYYWKGGIYGTRVTRGDIDDTKRNGSTTYTREVTGVTLDALRTMTLEGGMKDVFRPVANSATFVPDNVKHLEGHAFPFGTTTVAISGETTPVHYGMWPEESPAVGAAYVEYEIPYGTDEASGALRYQGFGYSIADDAGASYVSFDNLCTLHGGGDTNSSGFVYFWLNDRQESGNIPATQDGFIRLEDDDPFTLQVQSSLRSIFGKIYNVAVFKSADSTCIANKVEWDIKDQNNGKPRDMKVAFDPHFARIYLSGKEADGTEAKPYAVRNIGQFKNIEKLSGGAERLYFNQTHDFECAKVVGYAPFEVRNIEYSGHVYSIRNLTVEAEGAGNAALFSKAVDARFDGLILDAPTADNQESALRITTTKAVAAGLAAETEGVCSFTRCAVAGYDITSHGTTGGLVGVNYGELTVERSEAVYNPMGTGAGDLKTIGGLVGENKGTLTVSNSYAGGKIFSMKAESYNVGGLVGRHTGKGIDVHNCYCYMDMSELVYDGEGKLVYAVAPEGVNWDTCRYIARGLPAGAAWVKEGGEWVESEELGYGYGLTLFDSVLTGVKDGTEGTYTVAKSLGTWLREPAQNTGDWKLGQAGNRDRSEFPFMAVITYDDSDEYVHFGHSRYASFGTRPYIGFFQVYGTGGTEARLNPSQGPYYGFGWVRSEEGLIGATIPNDTQDTSDDLSALDDEDMENLDNITQTDLNGVKSFLPHMATSYGLLLPKGYNIQDTGVTVTREHSDKEYDRYNSGGTTEYLPWVEHNYCVYDTNGNIIIGEFYVEARDGKPFEIETREIPADRDGSTLTPDPGNVPDRFRILSDEVSKVELENQAAFADYDLYWFTTASISGLYDESGNPVSRSRTEFRLKFTFNYAEETIYTLPDPSAGGYPLTHELIVVTYRGT